MKHFAMEGYEVYTPVVDNATYDMIVCKDGEVKRVEVKSTSRKENDKYVVQLKKVRANKTENKIYNFDNTKMDLLAVYIIPEDRVLIYEANSITQKCTMQIK